MSITIKALRPLSELIGHGKVAMEWPGGTLEDLIRSLIEKSGPELKKELIEEDGSFAYAVSINGMISRDLSVPIRDGDEVFFFTPIGGG